MSRFALLTAVAVQVLAVLATPSKRADHLSCKGASFLSNGVPGVFVVDTTGVTLPDDGTISVGVLIPDAFNATAANSWSAPHNNANIKLQNELIIYDLDGKLTSGSTYTVKCQANWYNANGGGPHFIEPGYFTFKYQA